MPSYLLRIGTRRCIRMSRSKRKDVRSDRSETSMNVMHGERRGGGDRRCQARDILTVFLLVPWTVLSHAGVPSLPDPPRQVILESHNTHTVYSLRKCHATHQPLRDLIPVTLTQTLQTRTVSLHITSLRHQCVRVPHVNYMSLPPSCPCAIHLYAPVKSWSDYYVKFHDRRRSRMPANCSFTRLATETLEIPRSFPRLVPSR